MRSLLTVLGLSGLATLASPGQALLMTIALGGTLWWLRTLTR